MTLTDDLSVEILALLSCRDENEDLSALSKAASLHEWFEKTRKTAQINAIIVDHVARNPVNGRILFLKISPRVQPYDQEDRPGKEISWNVFATGSGPCLCAVFRTSAAPDDHYIALVNQYRVGVGRISTEIPAGLRTDGVTIDINALKEFKEETGLELRHDDIVEVSVPAASSPSTVSEEVTIFYASKQISAEMLGAMQKITDAHRENVANSPAVTAEIVPLKQAFRRVGGDMKSSLALHHVTMLLADDAIRNGCNEHAAGFIALARTP